MCAPRLPCVICTVLRSARVGSTGSCSALGGKRSRRARVAAIEEEIAGWSYELKRLSVLTGTTQAFIEVLAAQERVALNEELMKLAERGHGIVVDKVASGKVTPVERDNSLVELTASRLDLLEARRELAGLRRRLAAHWGGQPADFESAAGSLEDAPSPPLYRADNYPDGVIYQIKK